MNREEKIKAIYDKIADKTLSFGCKVLLKNQEIVMENQPVEYGTLENYEVMGSIMGRYGTLYCGGVTMEIEKIYFNDPYYSDEEVSDDFKEEFSFDENNEEKNGNLEIIGHPVMIGDVLDFIFENEMTKFENIGISEIKEKLIKLWIGNLIKPIEAQSDECIDFIYNLIK